MRRFPNRATVDKRNSVRIPENGITSETRRANTHLEVLTCGSQIVATTTEIYSFEMTIEMTTVVKVFRGH